MRLGQILGRSALYSVVVVISVFIIGSSAFAQIVVTNLDDSGAGSLRQAILDANANLGPDEIVFDGGLAGEIDLTTGQMVITDELIITGPGAEVITIDAQETNRIFSIGSVVSISGLKFLNGSQTSLGEGGGAIVNGGDLSIDSCVFENNKAVNGGAIFNGGTIIVIEQTTFNGNESPRGGAIRNNGAINKITHSEFIDNKAGLDDGLQRSNLGGAILNRSGGFIGEISHTTFSGNQAVFEGSDAFGGAIYNEGTITIKYSDFNGNKAIGGGAISNGGLINEITYSTFTGNEAGENGGAISNGINFGFVHFNGTTTTITHSTFTGNEAGESGGAIFNGFNGRRSTPDEIATISHSTFSGNMATSMDTEGGAIYNSGTIDNLINSTLSGNMSLDGVGGAIFSGGTMNISFTTIVNNEAAIVAGGIYSDDTTNIKNSIVGDNPTGGDCLRNFGTFTASGDNLDTDGTCVTAAGGVNFTQVTTGELNLDPLGLQDNGGATQTIALIGLSAAIDALTDCTNLFAEIVTTDQRGFLRPLPNPGSCDIGAYEEGSGPGLVTIRKLSIPFGGTGFSFSGSPGFSDGLESCEITQDFTLNDNESVSCAVPTGDYTVTENLPPGQVVSILCEEIPEGSSVDSLNGTISFTIEEGSLVDCLFINSSADTLVSFGDEPPGVNCEFGGSIIESGLDTNQNGMLDDGEVIPEDTVFVCNGAPGEDGKPGALLRVTEEPPGENCEFGGQKIETGIDANENGILDDNEVAEEAYLCNSEPGEDGGQGPQGPEGPAGGDPFNPIIDLTDIPPGSDCINGGVRIDTGLDLNRNGVLDPEEITDSSFICNTSGEDDGTADPNLNSGDGDSGNNGCSGSSLAGPGKISHLSDLLGLIVLPLIVILGRRLRRKK